MTAPVVPPEIACLNWRPGRLDEARDLVRRGQIVRFTDFEWSTESSLSAELSSLGEIFEPVSLPRKMALGQETQIKTTGVVTTATGWHHDQSFTEQPPDWSALHFQGGSPVPTVFSDGGGLLNLLSVGLRRCLSSLKAEHRAYSDDYERVLCAATHPVLVGHLEGEALFVSPANVEAFEDWSLQESAPLLDHLYNMMNWPELTVRHSWNVGDLVIWNNKRYLHRALPLDTGPAARRLSRVVGRWT